ncbi:MAG: thioredoxin domain-containing protein [Thermomicrobiales bacterium]|nr:thioredoxin domain-containing protein [Thermomicrobiales bacterium]
MTPAPTNDSRVPFRTPSNRVSSAVVTRCPRAFSVCPWHCSHGARSAPFRVIRHDTCGAGVTASSSHERGSPLANRLANETSPYLLQHKDNPVEWYAWGPEALQRARDEDKPILVSIGYSACHWCHVMEHESFENPETAAVMNARFVNIKVDREERPDLDSIYMTAVQAMSGQGGWPLNAFLTPEGVPFYGGTYWPPEDRMGMPAFRKVLEAVSEAYAERKHEVLANAEEIREYLRATSAANLQPSELDHSGLESAVEALEGQFDARHGGFGGAPKFPQPSVIEFLLRRHRAAGDTMSARMLRVTLDKMASGGIYDQIGGGFHRYAVDAIWLVPHFEKMLYDNAQLARNYLDAFRLFGEPSYRRIATEILDYTLREMTSPDGGFYATQDADSEGEEGKFYVWSAHEIDDVLGAEDGRVVRAYYGVTPSGNFEGHSILNVPRDPADVADALGMDEDRVEAIVGAAKSKLYADRAKRVWPGRDDKVIASWNGMMMRAFAEASRTFDRNDYRDAAVKNATFLLATLRRDGRLLRTYKDGVAKIDGFLEDYANVTDGLISLYEATFERRWLDEAIALAETMIAEFADPEGRGFYDTAASAERLVSRPRDLHDGATPAGNSVAASVLARLAVFTGRNDFEEKAVEVLRLLARPMAEQPIGFGRYLATLETYLGTHREIAVVGKRDDPAVADLAAVVYGRFEPNAILGYVDPDDAGSIDGLPFLEYRPMQKGMATAYLCEHFSCMPPVHDAAALEDLLTQGTGITWQEL